MSDELIITAELGEEARKFKESDVGKWLMGCAEQEALQAQIELASADPHDPKQIMRIQNRIRCANWFGEWVDELISRGNNAIEVFRQQRQEG